MTSKERVRRAIHFQGPDKLPVFLGDGLPNDISWLWPDYSSLGTPWHIVRENADPNLCIWEMTDAWGTTMRRFGPDGNGEAVGLPLENEADWSTYRFPDLIDAKLYTRDLNKAANAPDTYRLGVLSGGGSLFETAHKLRGLHNLLTDFYENPEFVADLLDRLVENECRAIDLLAELGCDGVMGYDDWGLQDRPMIGINMWNEWFRPRYKKCFDHAHAKGLDVWMHSCGYTLPMLKGWSEIGLNVAQLDQQQNMGLETLDRELGGKLAFWCPVDIQNEMIVGTPESVRSYVQRMMSTVGSHNGGLVGMSYSAPDVICHSRENLAAMFDEFRNRCQYIK